MGKACVACGHNIGRLEKLQIRVAMRVFRKASRRFRLRLQVEKYLGQCKKCMLKSMENRLEELKTEVYDDLHKTGKTQEELVEEVKKWVENEVPREARKIKGWR